jgi:hypothetical protein
MFTNINECLHHNQCGWCKETNKCILGNNLGPLELCNKYSYVYTMNIP